MIRNSASNRSRANLSAEEQHIDDDYGNRYNPSTIYYCILLFLIQPQSRIQYTFSVKALSYKEEETFRAAHTVLRFSMSTVLFYLVCLPFQPYLGNSTQEYAY